jgi:hypothetical protein
MSRKSTVPPMSELLRTKPDATDYSGMSVRSLHRFAEQGLLTKYRVGGRLRWHTRELDALVKRGCGSP